MDGRNEWRKVGTERNREEGWEKGRKEGRKEQSKNGKGVIYLQLVPIFPNLIKGNILYILKCINLVKNIKQPWI